MKYLDRAAGGVGEEDSSHKVNKISMYHRQKLHLADVNNNHAIAEQKTLFLRRDEIKYVKKAKKKIAAMKALFTRNVYCSINSMYNK